MPKLAHNYVKPSHFSSDITLNLFAMLGNIVKKIRNTYAKTSSMSPEDLSYNISTTGQDFHETLPFLHRGCVIPRFRNGGRGGGGGGGIQILKVKFHGNLIQWLGNSLVFRTQ